MSFRRPARGYAALVLAGRRSAEDALAAATGAPHRALLDIHGTPMLERVLRTLVATPCIREIVVSIDEPDLLARFRGLVELRRSEGARIVVVAATASPSRSVLAVLDEGTPEQPLLVTTADHALLSVEMVEYFLGQAEARGGDVAVGLVPESVLRVRFPDAIRTYLPFSGERYSGANLFAFQTPRARRAAEFWTRAESFRKRPWRMVATFGMRPLLLFLRRRLDLDAAFEEVSRVLGVHAMAVVMPQAEAAVDVDKLSDLELVNRILAEEGAAPAEEEASAADSTDPPASLRRDADQRTRSPSAVKPPLAAS
jgi:2-C-methyl-D-erythritol 4-phosphate cytidylyltransferase